jgi:prepilin-type N-terminal cleavage/methylation domain-containing protein
VILLSPRGQRGFSLVEVVITIGIVGFVVVGILGLFALGLRTGSESLETTKAANLSSLLLNQRRMVPIDGTNSPLLSGFSLPDLKESKSNFDPSSSSITPVYVGADGYATNVAAAEYALGYVVTKHARSASVYCLLYWPPRADLTNAIGRYEISTEIAVP